MMDLNILEIPKAKINQFNKKGIFDIDDLVQYFPRKYYDFRNITPINKLVDGDMVAVVGKVTEINASEKCVRIKVKDSSNYTLTIVWFNQTFVRKMLRIEETYIFCGKIQTNMYRMLQMIAPICFGTEIEKYQKIMPVYSKIKGMSDDYLVKTIETALALADKTEFLDFEIMKNFNLVRKAKALRELHQPTSSENFKAAKKRIVFDDLFTFCLQLKSLNGETYNDSIYKIETAEIVSKFIESLPFELTEGQLETLRAIFLQMKKGKRVNALIQGDVGCGKTIVAIILMLIAHENNFQAALMAPTNVLAKQHYLDLVEKVSPLGIKVGFLSGEMKAKEKKVILEDIKNGDIDLVVGTHAIIAKDVAFKNLALTIVDEEHRFGVVQRNSILEKAKLGVHSVIMSATPIPRTLAMTVYGDAIDIHTIKSLPVGRKPIKTALISNENQAYNFMLKEINEGRQCYIVCPLIEDSESEVMADVDSVENVYIKTKEYFKQYPNIKIAMISGKMKQSEVDAEIQKFSAGEYNVIISTTIIEVGVNVPNASTILIQNAERFGLSQLHQLRGRVGRGIHQSYCILLSKKIDNPKLNAMCKTTDGFEIAEIDLKLRGAGDFIGTKQSGQNKYIMLMLSYSKFYNQIKELVDSIFEDKKKLKNYFFLLHKDICDK